MRLFAVLLASLLLAMQLTAQPVINSFTPQSGTAGTAVTIKGTGFSSTSANNIVYFGAVKATATNATDTTLFVTVPVGATYQPVRVTTNNLTAYSTHPFIITFTGGTNSFAANSFLPRIDSTAGVYPHGVCLADFNNDGKSDLLVSRGSSDKVSVFPNTSSGGSFSLGTRLDFPAAGNSHEAAATGDLDGDGKTDFVITNSYNPNSVSVYRNTGTGNTISFASKIDYAADNGPYSMAIGDLNGDGKPDLAIANNGGSTINVYINTSTPGNISFGAKTDLSAGTNPYSVAINDLDGDGKPELAVTSQGSSSALAVLRNTSTGGVVSFSAAITVATFGGPFVVAIGDLDNDGKPDLAAASAGANAAVVVRNTSTAGTLSFAAPQNFTTGNYPVCVSIADLNGDGQPELIATNRFSNSVSVLRNTSTAGAMAFDAPVSYAVNADPFFAAVGDLDGDGRPDIAVANSSSTFVSILRNIVGANIAPVITSFTPSSGISNTIVKISGSNFTGATSVKFGGVEAASFIIDSATGITATVGAGATGNVSVTTATGTATLPGFTFNGPVISSFTPAIGVAGTIVTITGINFTGVTEVKFGGIPAASFTVNNSTTITATVGAGSSGSVTVVTANGTATLTGFNFGVPTIAATVNAFTPVSGPAGSIVTITGTNFSATPADNIVFFGAVKATVSAATTTQLTVVVPAGATHQPISVTTNNLTAYSSLPFIISFPSDVTTIADTSFNAIANYGTGTYPSAVSISDLDNDGKPDVLVANAVGNNISIFKNSSTIGTVTLSTKTDYATGTDPKRINTGDLDGDGKQDIVVTNFNAGNASTIAIFRNNSTSGTIALTAKTDYSTGMGSIGTAIADMDGDGKPDIIVASGNSGFFSFFKNTTTSPGSITLAPKQDFTLLTHGDNIITVDLDKDGRPDLVTSNFSASTISVFRNTSTGGFFSLAPGIDFPAGTYPSFITSGDLDNDGKVDLILTNYTANTSLFRNNSTPGNISLSAKQDLPLGPTTVAIADLNGDGKIDLFAGRGLTGLTSVLANTYTGTGSFSFAPQVDFTTGSYDTFTASGDLDGDGKPELIAVNTIQNTLSILRNKIGDPVISNLSLTTANKGAAVTLTGKKFTGATAVDFGGTPASSFTVVSPTQINAVVGGGASGNIRVVTPQGAATIAGFNFTPEISAAGATTFCKDGSVVLTSSAAANNQWYKDGVAVNGATANTLQATASGSYTVKTTSNSITTVSPTGVSVTVVTVPTPLITKNAANELVSSAASGNQWYMNGVVIAGAIAQTYLPTQNGSYTVKASANGCTSDFSAAHQFALTGIIELGNNQFIKLFPNPIKDKLTINWNINGVYSLTVAISDIQGRQVLLNNNIHNGATVDFSKLPQGAYFIKVYSNNQLKINSTVKVIKGN